MNKTKHKGPSKSELNLNLTYHRKVIVQVANFQSVHIEFGVTSDGGFTMEEIKKVVDSNIREELMKLGSQYFKLFYKSTKEKK